MAKKKKKPINWQVISSIVFVFSSIILLVNNLTDFFRNYNISVDINTISWIAIVFSIIWWMILFGRKNKMW